MTSPLSAPTLSSLLDAIPEQSHLEESEPVLLTCPHCSYITTSTATSLACTRCLRRFRRNERRERDDVERLTLFPTLLEEHGVLKEREQRRRHAEGGGGGLVERMINAVWGGKNGGGSAMGRRDSVISTDERTGSEDYEDISTL
jgi:hypothetical protein